MILLLITSCKENNKAKLNPLKEVSKADSALIKSFMHKAYRSGLYSQGFQQNLDSVLKITPNNAYIWQQKSMPCFKHRKYEVGMPFLDNAVRLEPENYLNYRAFIKCIFSKQYKESLEDFKAFKKVSKNTHVMDHTLEFYMGLCSLQLNKFEDANAFFKKAIAIDLEQHSEEWLHPSDLFYLGVSEFELKRYNQAIQAFDKALENYSNFGDAQYYKAKCLSLLGKEDEAKKLFEEAFANIELGNTISEANAIYEVYPYQIGRVKKF